MSSIGSFGTFTTARLAIYVSQKGLSVTGNNIANINTAGYTRQRLDQVSFKTGGSDRYQTDYDMRVGNGAIAKTVSQLRDPYLDVRFRAENSSVGFYDGKLGGLNDIATVLDEIGKGEKDGDGLIYAQMSDFFKSLQNLQTSSGTEVNDTLVFNSADALCQLFQSGAARLERLRANTETQLRQELDDINGILTSIRNLNESIEQAEIYGDKALELRDERNVLIDSLSEKLKIDVTYSMVDMGLGSQVEKLTIRLGNANPDKDVQSDSSLLVDGNYCAQLTTPKANPTYDPAYEVYTKNSEAYLEALKTLQSGTDDAQATFKLPDGTEVTFPYKAQEGETLPDEDQPVEDPPVKTAKELLDAAIKDFLDNKENIPDEYYAYVDANGQLTNDPRQAAQEFDSGYNITVSDLRDKNNQAWVNYDRTRTAALTPAQTKDFPTRARYTGTFKMDGQWKDGDKITVTVGGQDYTVEIGSHPTAKEANEDPKNVSNAIRDALVKAKEFRDDEGKALYNISTTTTKNNDGSYNVQLSIFKKEAGTAEVPEIQISLDTGAQTKYEPGVATVGTPAAVDGKDGQFSAAVEVTKKFEKGDVITYGNAKLVVGKDVSVNGASNAKTLAAALAQKLKVDGFTVKASTDKDNKTSLVFTSTAEDPKTAAAPVITPELKIEPPKDASFEAVGEPKKTAGTAGTFDIKPGPTVQDNGDNTTSTEAKIYYQDDNDNWYRASMTGYTSKTKVLDDNDLYGKLQAVRELLTEEGEFASQADIDNDESAAIKRGIPYYQHCLDLLAKKFAETMNDANTGYAVDQDGNYLTKGGKKLELAGEPVNKDKGLTQDQKDALIADGCVKEDGTPDLARWLKAKEGDGDDAIDKLGGNLFSVRGDTDDATGITAANISVAQSWSNGTVHVVPTYTKLFRTEDDEGVTNTTQNDNALHMGNLWERALVYNPQDLLKDAVSEHLFEGSFSQMFVKMSNTLGNDQRSTKVSLQNHTGQALDIDTNRDAVSAVDLNDEAMDLMQYTHSLNAAYRLMTTLDEMLERLITGTGVTR